MALKSWALGIAGAGSKSVFFGRRDLMQRQSLELSSFPVNAPGRRKLSAEANLTLQPAPVPAQASCILRAGLDPLFSLTQRTADERERITPEKLDEVMRDSVKEIVRNVSKAPFLMHVFLGEGGPVDEKWRLFTSLPRFSVVSEKATAKSWPEIKKRWEQDSCVPDGIILVEEIEDEGAPVVGTSDEGEFRRWGVVIEGRGSGCSACYILNTCSERSPIGCSTHFCLVKAKPNGDPVGVQVMNAWLQRGGREENNMF